LFKAGPLFEANFNSTADTIVNQGGTSSGKTFGIMQAIFAKLADRKRAVCTVAGQDIPNLKAGALRDSLEIYATSPELQSLIKSYNKSERIFEYHNGSIIEFKSYSDAQDAKSGKRDFLFINEAQGVLWQIREELSLRTKEQEFIDYNPNAEFWVHENLVGKPGVEQLISDHRHNPYLLDKQRAKIEGLALKDEELWKVYARGLTGKIEGLVLRDWHVATTGIPLGAKYLGTGLDFGFTNDPTTAIDLYLSGGELWADEVLYETGLTNTDIVTRLGKVTGRLAGLRWDIVADSAEPKSIEDLRRARLTVEGAQKGPDSVRNGLDMLKRYRLNVTVGSVHLRKELANYKWKVDRATGKPTNEPVDAFNHCIDALRYVALNRLPKATERRKSAQSSLIR
jgi:phage terminase large subunit